MTDQRLLGALYAWGADPDSAINRLLGDEEFYLDLVGKFSGGLDYKEVRSLNEKNDLEGAFLLVHRMKGSCADLSLTPLFEILDEMTEELRPLKHGLSEDQLERFESIAKGFLALTPGERMKNGDGAFHP